MAMDHERQTSHDYRDYVDRARTGYSASGWGMVLGIIALLAILGFLLIGISSTPDTTNPQPAVERTTPTPAPAPTPAPTPTTPSPAPN